MNAGIDISDFIGTWHLLPESCRYAFGRPPADGRYAIDQSADGEVLLESEWISASGRRHVLRFLGPIDGRPHPLAHSRIAEAIQLDYVSPQQFNSSAWRGGYKVMWAERRLIQPGELRIDVHGRLANGAVYTNTDVYRRHRP